MPIEVVVPIEPERRRPKAPVRMPRWRPKGPVTVGLVDNSKPLARQLLEATARALTARNIADGHILVSKPMASRIMDEEERADLLARSRLVLTGVGD